jgi:Mn-dependent DtxR family transcriptional regulator
MDPTRSIRRYVALIYELQRARRPPPGLPVAWGAAPLATAGLKRLGLVEHEPYRGAIRTPEGENAAPSTRPNNTGSGILLELGYASAAPAPLLGAPLT